MFLNSHLRKNFERLRKSLLWYEKRLEKEIDEFFVGKFSEDYAIQKCGELTKLYKQLVHVDEVRVRVDIILTGRGTHRINGVPDIRITKENKPSVWVGDEPCYFYYLEVV